MSESTSLKSVAQYGAPGFSDNLEFNFYMFFQWGLLGIGGFTNVTLPASSGAYGGDRARLRCSEDPNFDKGQIWEGFRSDWVWETGVEYSTQPIRVSGVYVNGTFHPSSGVGPYAHSVNYPLGRVVFDAAVSPSSVVRAEYSYRACQLSTADSPWWRQIHTESFRVDDSQFLQYGSGAYSVLAQNRVQLPAIIFEALADTSRHGFELGNQTATVTQGLLAHVLTETHWDRKQLTDLVSSQWPKRLVGVDKGRMLSEDAFPLDPDGSPSPSGKMDPLLIKPSGEGGFMWRQLRIKDTRGYAYSPRPPLYYAAVLMQVEADLP